MRHGEIIRLIKYLLYVAFIIIVMSLINRYMFSLQERAMEEWFFYMAMGIPVLIGILAGIPSFIAAYREEGTWYLDWVKVIAITLPALLILSLPHLYFSSPLGKFIPLSSVSVILSDTNRIISGFVFGFTLLSFPEKRTSSHS